MFPLNTNKLTRTDYEHYSLVWEPESFSTIYIFSRRATGRDIVEITLKQIQILDEEAKDQKRKIDFVVEYGKLGFGMFLSQMQLSPKLVMRFGHHECMGVPAKIGGEGIIKVIADMVVKVAKVPLINFNSITEAMEYIRKLKGLSSTLPEPLTKMILQTRDDLGLEDSKSNRRTA
jgi:hypothetical protein